MDGRRKCKGAQKRWMEEEIEGLRGKALKRGGDVSAVDGRKAITESVDHLSGQWWKPGQLQMSAIDQAAENRPVKETVFTSSLLLCLIMGSQRLWRCRGRTGNSKKMVEKKMF